MAEDRGQANAALPLKPKAEPFALAGVYDVWKVDGGQAITSFAIVTTDAAPSTAQYHDRMPVVLEDSQFDEWMRGTPDQAAAPMPDLENEIDAIERQLNKRWRKLMTRPTAQ